MPCDQIVLCKVDLSNTLTNAEFLVRALASVGNDIQKIGDKSYMLTIDGVRVTLKKGQLTVPAGFEHLGDTIKRAYSEQVIREGARRHGFTLKETVKSKLAGKTFIGSKRRLGY